MKKFAVVLASVVSGFAMLNLTGCVVETPPPPHHYYYGHPHYYHPAPPPPRYVPPPGRYYGPPPQSSANYAAPPLPRHGDYVPNDAPPPELRSNTMQGNGPNYQ